MDISMILNSSDEKTSFVGKEEAMVDDTDLHPPLRLSPLEQPDSVRDYYHHLGRLEQQNNRLLSLEPLPYRVEQQNNRLLSLEPLPYRVEQQNNHLLSLEPLPYRVEQQNNHLLSLEPLPYRVEQQNNHLLNPEPLPYRVEQQINHLLGSEPLPYRPRGSHLERHHVSAVRKLHNHHRSHSHSPPYRAPSIHTFKPQTSSTTPHPTTTATTPNPPRSKKVYSLEAIDFIRYNKVDLDRGWDEIFVLYLKRFPFELGIRDTSQCLNSRYYRDNYVPLVDSWGNPMWDEKGKLMLDNVNVRQRSRPVGLSKGVPNTLVERHPDRAVNYEWVLKRDKKRAMRICRGEEDEIDGIKAHWRQIFKDLDRFRYSKIWGMTEAKKQKNRGSVKVAKAVRLRR